MWWSVHQPQWGSPELRHSPQVVYCSQDSTGTRDTCKGSKGTGSALLPHSGRVRREQLQGLLRRFDLSNTTAIHKGIRFNIHAGVSREEEILGTEP